MSDAVIRKFLDLSTAHMTENDSEILNENPQPLTVAKFDEGYFVCVGPKESPLNHIEKVGLSAAFLKVMRYAQEHGCSWVLFDQDAEINRDLPIFDW